ncbi:T6SS effector phospholipase Tle3 domain-containing protein [Burkholderia stagnalis]|uniref:T6SS effector phospholipase Tle3 domain-containing protein n=2 Tax=Burkholderia stagnalis TaxID=1503054 RepID=UPI000A85DA60
MAESFLNPDMPAGYGGGLGGTTQSRAAQNVVVGQGQGSTLPDHLSELICVKQQPLPGVVIFVHGVNSEGEWFEASEKGLCAGLNARLGRLDDQMAHKGICAGQLHEATYTESLTPDGFLNPELLPTTYIKSTPSFSPVIHFRWGYKANAAELKEYGDKIFLNEDNYWGGGPFANGCSSLPDLWHEGVDDRIFGFISVQAVNPTSRMIFRTPPRAYGVLAALRLAKLVQSIREKQANVPITIVCHSQGNMVGMTAAFFGDKLGSVTDRFGNSGRCVADAYVLANPPYSLANTNFMESWSQRRVSDKKGHAGRETYEARVQTLKTFVSLIRERVAFELPPDKVDQEMKNERISKVTGHGYKAAEDRHSRGVNEHTYGRVTLYCCPHDQVISAATVQGMGWRGLSDEEMSAIEANGSMTQRVFASGFTVGVRDAKYNYWTNDWRHGKGATPGFWFPPSPPARYGFRRALSGNENPIAKLFTTIFAPVLEIATIVSSSFNVARVNEDPPKDWTVTCSAPELPVTFDPKAKRFGKEIEVVEDGAKAQSYFNETYDPPSSARDAGKAGGDKKANDPYDAYHPKEDENLPGDANGTQVRNPGDPQGTAGSEAAQRYEDRAILRMVARRTGNSSWVDSEGNVIGEDGKSDLPDGYKEWRDEKVVQMLDAGMKNSPTNHSTIMTNDKHAEMALAYDVAVGVCHISPGDLDQLRIEADWRFGKYLDKGSKLKSYADYFLGGKMGDSFLQDWVKIKDGEGAMPEKIEDEREGQILLVVGGAL